MTISSSLNAGLAGLATNASRLATISDNIANASTVGYKRVQTDFQSVVNSSGNGPYTAGGVRATTERMVADSGSLITTSNPTDLAVRGAGFLPVVPEAQVKAENGNPQMRLTSTGSFRQDSEGYLKTSSGMILMGWPANPDGSFPEVPRDTTDALEPIRINTSQLTASPTTKIELGVNLPWEETQAGASGDSFSLSVEYFNNVGGSESLLMEFTPTVPTTGASNEWNMVVRDSASGGAVIGEYDLTFEDGVVGGGTLSTVTAVSGGAYDGTSGSVIVATDSGPVEINIGTPGDASRMVQLADNFTPIVISKDGAAPGNIVGIEVDVNGRLIAQYDTGVSQFLYKIPVADLANPNGMVALDQQTFLPSATSGAFFLWDVGTGPTGELVSNALEESSTDVATELTAMIQTQRAYSSNAKVIQTVDEMLQETTNIKR